MTASRIPESDELAQVLGPGVIEEAVSAGVMLKLLASPQPLLAGYRDNARTSKELQLKFGRGRMNLGPEIFLAGYLFLGASIGFCTIPRVGQPLATLMVLSGLGYALLDTVSYVQISIASDTVRVRRRPVAFGTAMVVARADAPKFQVEHWRFAQTDRYRLSLALADGRAVKLRDFNSAEVPELVADVANRYLASSET